MTTSQPARTGKSTQGATTQGKSKQSTSTQGNSKPDEQSAGQPDSSDVRAAGLPTDDAPEDRVPTADVPADRVPAADAREDRVPTADATEDRVPADGTSASRTGNPVPEADVAAMFDNIAPVYDRMNTLMTLGFDGRWRRAAVNAAHLSPGDAVIDVACGTGKLAGALAERVGPFGRVLAVDLAPGMIAEAETQNPDLVQLEFTVADALSLPAGEGAFDAATIAFGLRNLPNFEAAFRELARVVRPGGWVVCLELSVPRPRIWGRVYHGAFRRSAPLIGSLFGRRKAYTYLPQSLEGFPNPDELVRTMIRAGLVEVSYRRLALGAVALHKGRVPR
jgi:demethylmenaquinone methyltransferase/2-methoxy-6-polyprenyl-1,4-benzoquinol methylase